MRASAWMTGMTTAICAGVSPPRSASTSGIDHQVPAVAAAVLPVVPRLALKQSWANAGVARPRVAAVTAAPVMSNLRYMECPLVVRGVASDHTDDVLGGKSRDRAERSPRSVGHAPSIEGSRTGNGGRLGT